MEIGEILELLPHRYPILLLDRVAEIDIEGQRIVGVKNVSINEPFFQGHFPGMPVMPGVLQLEAMAQTAGILLMKITGNTDTVPYFMAIDKAKFRQVVKPGDQMLMEIQVTQMRAKVARFSAKARVEGKVVSQAEMMCMFSDEGRGQ